MNNEADRLRSWTNHAGGYYVCGHTGCSKKADPVIPGHDCCGRCYPGRKCLLVALNTYDGPGIFAHAYARTARRPDVCGVCGEPPKRTERRPGLSHVAAKRPHRARRFGSQCVVVIGAALLDLAQRLEAEGDPGDVLDHGPVVLFGIPRSQATQQRGVDFDRCRPRVQASSVATLGDSIQSVAFRSRPRVGCPGRPGTEGA